MFIHQIQIRVGASLQTETRPFEIVLGGEPGEDIAEPGDVVIYLYGLEVEKERVCLFGLVDEEDFHDVWGDLGAVFETVLHDGGAIMAGCCVQHGGKGRREGGVRFSGLGYQGCDGSEIVLRAGVVERVAHAGSEFDIHDREVRKCGFGG